MGSNLRRCRPIARLAVRASIARSTHDAERWRAEQDIGEP